jgi:hypothetical protein
MKEPLSKARTNLDRSAAFGPVAHNAWQLGREGFNLVRKAIRPVAVRFDTQPQSVELGLVRSALVVIDMQNDLCHQEGWFGKKGISAKPMRKPIPAIARLLPAWRQASGAVVWVNWGAKVVDELAVADSGIAVFKHHLIGFWDNQPDCILLSDVCSTPSPAYVSRAIHFIVMQLHGFVATSAALIPALPKPRNRPHCFAPASTAP